jgi:hypothetical protein
MPNDTKAPEPYGPLVVKPASTTWYCPDGSYLNYDNRLYNVGGYHVDLSCLPTPTAAANGSDQ